MSKQTAKTLNEQLSAVTKELDKEIEAGKAAKMPAHELTALKTWRGIVGRVAVDLAEFGK